MSRYKLGCLPATKPFGVADLAVYAKGRLPEPPPSVDAPAVADWGMDGNDQYGDCTIAGVDHLIAAWDVTYNGPDSRPVNSTIVETYFSLTNGQDSGLNENTVLETWRTQGLFGNKIAAYAPVNPTSIVDIHQAVAFYGAAYLGIAIPESAQEDFQNNAPWTVHRRSPIEGGHCIVCVGYDAQGLLCVSWGRLVQVTYPFVQKYFQEAWAIVSNQLIEANGDSGLDLNTLTADLNGLAA